MPPHTDSADNSLLANKLEALEKKILSRFTQLEKTLRTVQMIENQDSKEKKSAHSIFCCYCNISALLILVILLFALSSQLLFSSKCSKLHKQQEFMLKHFKSIFKFEAVSKTTVSSQFNHLSKMVSSLLTIQIEDIEVLIKDYKLEFDNVEQMQLKSIEETKFSFQQQLNTIQFKNHQDLLKGQNEVKSILLSIKDFKLFELDKVNLLESESLLTRLRKCAALRGRLRRLLDKVNIFKVNGFVETNVNSEAVKLQLSDLEERLYELYNYFDEIKSQESLKYKFALRRGQMVLQLNEYYTNLTGIIAYNSHFEKKIGINLYNVYNVNLIFVWSVNCTHMDSLKENHAYYSENFAAAGIGKSFLLLYKDKNRPGMWEITYNQNRSSFLYDSFTVSIMNQIREEQLLCPESPIGESPKDNIAMVTKFFSIPLTQEQMIKDGYIHNDMLYIKCAVD